MTDQLLTPDALAYLQRAVAVEGDTKTVDATTLAIAVRELALLRARVSALEAALRRLVEDDRGRTYIDNTSTVCLYCGVTIRVRADWTAAWRDHMPHNANCPVAAALALLDGGA